MNFDCFDVNKIYNKKASCALLISHKSPTNLTHSFWNWTMQFTVLLLLSRIKVWWILQWAQFDMVLLTLVGKMKVGEGAIKDLGFLLGSDDAFVILRKWCGDGNIGMEWASLVLFFSLEEVDVLVSLLRWAACWASLIHAWKPRGLSGSIRYDELSTSLGVAKLGKNWHQHF